MCFHAFVGASFLHGLVVHIWNQLVFYSACYILIVHGCLNIKHRRAQMLVFHHF